MNNEGKMEETPEWQLFKRIENLEAIVPTLRDAYGLAVMAFVISFIHQAETEANPRQFKDVMITSLEPFVSPGLMKILQREMLEICESIEKERGGATP